MLVKLKELREKRNQLITEARGVLDRKEADYEQKYDAIYVDIEKVDKELEREERQLEQERKLIDEHDRQQQSRQQENPKQEDRRVSTDPRVEARKTPEYRAAFNTAMALGMQTLNPNEVRALSAGSDIAGGYLVPPEQFVAELIQAVDDAVTIRPLARKFRLTTATSLGAPALDTDASDSDWTTEILVGNEETTIAFGKRALTPHPLAKLAKISNTLLRQSAISAEQILRERLAYKFALTENKAFLSGTGAQKPLGVFTASNDGIPTTRDVSTGNSATAIGADGLIEAKYSLKQPYWAAARWIFSRTAVKNIRKLKDGEGQYLWQPGMTGGLPDRIFETPYLIDENCPATFTTGLYVGIIGDFSKYWIVDALDMQVQRLVELYAATNQVGFIGRLECDGMPVLGEAFARVTLA